jgi:hypothetical protein
MTFMFYLISTLNEEIKNETWMANKKIEEIRFDTITVTSN